MCGLKSLASLPFSERRFGIVFLATGRPRREQRAIDTDIILRHPRGGEALLETPTHLVSIECEHARERRDRASSMVSTIAPVTPSSTISGTEPQRNARTGVPQAIASIMERPKGSGQSTGNSSARALPRNSFFDAR